MWNRRQMRALTSRLILTAVLSSVLGCSTTFSLGYEMGPFLVSRELEKRLPLSDAAESKLDQDLEVYFQWHRGKMLGEYVTTLEAWRKEARGGRSTELWLWPDIGRLIADTLLPLGEIVCEPMSRYSTEEVAELRRLDAKAREKQKERRGDTPEEERERRWEAFESFLEDFIGDFEEQQTERWRVTFDAAMAKSNARRGEGRQQWDAFVAELEQGMSFTRCFEFMQQWMVPEPKARAERNKHWTLIYDQVLSELTQEQRAHLDEELQTWISRFQGLQD